MKFDKDIIADFRCLSMDKTRDCGIRFPRGDAMRPRAFAGLLGGTRPLRMQDVPDAL